VGARGTKRPDKKKVIRGIKDRPNFLEGLTRVRDKERNDRRFQDSLVEQDWTRIFEKKEYRLRNSVGIHSSLFKNPS